MDSKPQGNVSYKNNEGENPWEWQMLVEWQPTHQALQSLPGHMWVSDPQQKH